MNNKVGFAIVMGLSVNSMGAMDPSALNQIKLITNDKEEVTITTDELHHFEVIRDLVENASSRDEDEQEAIPLPNVSFAVFDQFLKNIRGNKTTDDNDSIESVTPLLKGALFLNSSVPKKIYAKKMAEILCSDALMKKLANNEKDHPVLQKDLLCVGSKNAILSYLPAMWRDYHTIKHDNSPLAVSFSSNSKMLMIKNGYQMVRVFDLALKTVAYTNNEMSWVDSVSFSPDNKYVMIASSSDKAVRIFDLVAKNLKHMITLNDPVISASFSPDNKYVMAVLISAVQIFYLNNGRSFLTITPQADMLYSASFSSDGKHVVITSSKNGVRIFDLATKSFKYTITLDSPASLSLFSPDNNYLVMKSDKTVQIFDLKLKQILHTIKHTGAVKGVSISPNGEMVATASLDKTVQIFDLKSKQILHTFAHEGAVFSALFSPDSMQVVTASEDKTTRVYDLTSGMISHTITHADLVHAASLSPDNKYLVTASLDKTAKIVKNIADADFDQSLLCVLVQWCRANNRSVPKSEWVQRVLGAAAPFDKAELEKLIKE